MEKETVLYVLKKELKDRGYPLFLESRNPRRFVESRDPRCYPHLYFYSSVTHRGLEEIPLITYVFPPEIHDDRGYLSITLVSEIPLLVTPEVNKLLLRFNTLPRPNFYAIKEGQICLNGIVPFNQQSVQAHFRRQGTPLYDEFLIRVLSCAIRFTLNHSYIRQVGEGKLTVEDVVERERKRARERTST